MPDPRWHRAIFLLFPAVFPPLQLLLFGPHTLYAGNQQEFSAPFWNIVVHLLPMIAAITAALLIIGALLAVTAAKADPEARAKWEGAPDAIFELSSKQNVFHFVLDGFQSDVFLDIVESDRAEMDRRFSGFTFFANHAGASRPRSSASRPC